MIPDLITDIALTFVGELTLHSPRRASMAGSVRDVTAHLLDDAQPDALSQAEPLVVQQVVQAVAEVPVPDVASPCRPAGEPTAQGTLLLAKNHFHQACRTQDVHYAAHLCGTPSHEGLCTVQCVELHGLVFSCHLL